MTDDDIPLAAPQRSPFADPSRRAPPPIWRSHRTAPMDADIAAERHRLVCDYREADAARKAAITRRLAEIDGYEPGRSRKGGRK